MDLQLQDIGIHPAKYSALARSGAGMPLGTGAPSSEQDQGVALIRWFIRVARVTTDKFCPAVAGVELTIGEEPFGSWLLTSGGGCGTRPLDAAGILQHLIAGDPGDVAGLIPGAFS